MVKESPKDALSEAIRLWEEGSRRQMKDDVDGAIDLYRRSIAILPTAEAHTFLGWAMSFKGDIEGAIAECRRAIEIDPDFGNPYNDIGAYLVELGRPTEAIPWLEQAKTAKRYAPRHFPYVNLARIYASRGQATKAILELEQALTIEPGDPVSAGMLDKLRALN
jgi:Tfp pilus assembly protein PilF